MVLINITKQVHLCYVDNICLVLCSSFYNTWHYAILRILSVRSFYVQSYQLGQAFACPRYDSRKHLQSGMQHAYCFFHKKIIITGLGTRSKERQNE